MGVQTYIVYHIDKALRIITSEAFDHLDLVTFREDGRYQRDAVVYGRGIADQPFPGWGDTAHGKTIKLPNA